MERLLIAMDEELEEPEGLDVYVMPMGDEARDLAVQITAMLRANGFSVDMDYQGRSLKAQFKTVDRLNSHFAMIIGDQEIADEVVNIKCTHSKTQDIVPIENIVAYIENHMEGHGHE